MLVETIQGLDDIKSLQAETRFQNLWNHYNEVTATSSMQLRSLVNKLSSWAQTVQGAVYAVILFFGAPLVMSGEMSTGVLVAASMLSSRMIVPLTSLTSIVSRWQQAKVAREGIDRLMALPVDTPAEGQRIHVHALRGEFEIRKASFGHEPEVPVLSIDKLSIAPGERVAILGRNGAGKSTLLLGLSGLLSPLLGDARVDGLTMDLVDPADLRRDLGYLGQGARLFHGTLRENLALGAPLVQDAAILEVLDSLGLGNFLKRLPDGLDHLVQEGGIGLSGGQRQGLLLERLLLRRPRVLLLDEPTASLDDTSEGRAIDTLAALPADAGIVIATHRTAVLRLVNRLIVVNNGTIVMDGEKEAVLVRLRGEKVSP
jgi:ATP-binding cassette subfamily C protein LapB